MRRGAGGWQCPRIGAHGLVSTDWNPRIGSHGLVPTDWYPWALLGGEGLLDFFEQLGCFEGLEEE